MKISDRILRHAIWYLHCTGSFRSYQETNDAIILLSKIRTKGYQMITTLNLRANVTRTMVNKISKLPEFTEHYSIYTPGGWSAISLRSFGGSPQEISKPSCMNAAWHKKNPGAKNWEIKDTSLRAALKLESLINLIPGEKERIRLMRLAARAEILPHTDRIDQDFKTGKLRRIHIPIITNDKVVFWDENQDYKLKVGQVYFLDAGRKHSVKNDGKTDRVHLVMDVISNPNLESLIENGVS